VKERPTLLAVVESERPSRWVSSILAYAADLPHLRLAAVTVDAQCRPVVRSPIAAAVLSLYDRAERVAYPLSVTALDRAPLAADLRRLIVASDAVGAVEWVLDLRTDADAGGYADHARRGLIRVRNRLAAGEDRSVLDAIRRRSPIESVVEALTGRDTRVLARTVGAPHPLSLRHTLDTAFRRCEVLLRRTLSGLDS